MLAVPSNDEAKNDLTFLLNKQMKQICPDKNIYPCHRLDKETSGLMIFAKGKKNQQIIMDLFRQRQIKKGYIAFIQGKLKQKKGTLKNYIGEVWPYPPNGKKKQAITKYEVILSPEKFSVLKLEPLTGRKNQIRVQFRDIGNPLVGDRRFAITKDWLIKFRRTALHAYFISFRHPYNKTVIKLRSDLPKDMHEFLGQYGVSLQNVLK